MSTTLTYDDAADIVTLLSTELNSLVNNGRILADAYDPGGQLYGDLELAIEYTTSAPLAGVIVAEVAFLPTADGTHYPEGSSTVDPQRALLVATFESRNGSTSGLEYLYARGIPLPARSFKAHFKNLSGKTLAASGNTLKLKPYPIQNG